MTETYDVTLPSLVAASHLPGAMFWRQNCGTFLTLDGRRHVQATSVPGLGDIMGAFRGWPVAGETKSRTGRMRKTQETFRKKWTASGGIYIIARTADEFTDALLALPERS